ncbi:monovalent cation/H+ antiporter complex subunit F [Ilumatobacter sp.]|uniref:monovalent cation/H+ antiporter complex subunit F n=1 Tax=Ilumatobacter sp. TaxID=1967498 RepID=UPI003B52D6FA
MIDIASSATFAALIAAAVLAVARLARRGSLPDRLLGLDSLLLIAVAALATHAAWTGSGIFLDVLVVASLLGFVGAVFIAALIEERS